MKFKDLLNIVLAILIFTSCSRKIRTVPTENTQEKTIKTIKEVQRDTIVRVKADSTFYKAWIDCIDNKPILKESTIFIEDSKRNYIEPLKVVLKDNLLAIDCKSKAQELFIKWKENHQFETKEIIKEVILPPELIEKELSWWQKLFITIGKIAMGGSLIFILVKVIAWKSLLKL